MKASALLRLFVLINLIFPLIIHADKKTEKRIFEILAENRTDISPDLIKRVKKEMGNYDDAYPRIHDGWIENPWGKSLDMQGNVLFPDIDYVECKQISPTHFILKVRGLKNGYGLVRTDNTVIIPFEHEELQYYAPYNLIIAFSDCKDYTTLGRGGTIKIYNTYGDVLGEYRNCKDLEMHNKFIIPNELKVKIRDENGTHDLTFRRTLSDNELNLLTNFFYEGPQAATYNVIRSLCASNKKGNQKKAMDLLDYYTTNILPDNFFSRSETVAAWDATVRYLACMSFTNDFGRWDNQSKELYGRYNFIYSPPTYFIPDGVEPKVLNPRRAIPATVKLSEQASDLLNLAVNTYKQKQIQKEQQTQMWLTVLGVLSNSLSGNGGYSPVSGDTYSSNTTSVPHVSSLLIDQVTVSPELITAAYQSGWRPETVSSSEPSSSKSSSSSTSTRVCQHCWGKGTHPSCNGTGRRMAFGNKHIESCSDCHGTGKCPSCTGVGHH